MITVTIGLLSVPRYTRVARASTLSLAEREFVLGPWLAGVAYDAVGSYELAMFCGALFSAGAAACVAILMHGGQAKAFHRG